MDERTGGEMMADAAHKRVEELFQQAVDLPVEQREAFLEQACGSDEALKTELAALLAQSNDASHGANA